MLQLTSNPVLHISVPSTCCTKRWNGYRSSSCSTSCIRLNSALAFAMNIWGQTHVIIIIPIPECLNSLNKTFCNRTLKSSFSGLSIYDESILEAISDWLSPCCLTASILRLNSSDLMQTNHSQLRKEPSGKSSQLRATPGFSLVILPIVEVKAGQK
jgi:hypothetical protein